jgi:NifU-like protein
VSFYPEKISRRFHAPRNVGKATGANAVGTEATFVCGAAARFTLRIDKTDKKILEARFQTSGCGFLTASADALADKIKDENLSALHGLETDRLAREIEAELGRFPADRKHCLETAVAALRAAFADFRAAQIEEFAGEQALICTCFGVSEETVERVVEEHSLETVEQVGAVCRAGTGCGSCRFLIQEILDSRLFY